jgi:hypothetical protein
VSSDVGPDQRSYSQDVSLENGVGARDIFGMFWVSIEIIIYLENLLYNTTDIDGKVR